MKHKYTKMMSLAIAVTLAVLSEAQTADTVGFETFSIPADSFDNGKYNSSGEFKSGPVIFTTSYDTSFGGFWSGGFALTTRRDSITPDYKNLYSSISAGGNNSYAYAAAQTGATIKTQKTGIPDAYGYAYPKFVYVNNNTYVYRTIQNGYFNARKFRTGDYFLLTIKARMSGKPNHDSVSFYLADYRDSDTTKHYIINKWIRVDLSALDSCEEITFELRSTDTGSFGMNTPAFFCIDDFAYEYRIYGGFDDVNKTAVRVFPNPAHDHLNIDTDKAVSFSVHDLSGKEIQRGECKNVVNVSALDPGMYMLMLYTEKAERSCVKFVKE